MTDEVRSAGFESQVRKQTVKLVRNFVLLGILVGGICMAAMIYFDRRQVDILSMDLINKSAFATKLQLESFFKPLRKNLMIIQRQLAAIPLDEPGSEQKYIALLTSLMNAYPQLSGFTTTDESGERYFTLSRDGDEYTTRRISTDPWGDRQAHWKRWKNGMLVEKWQRRNDFDPSTREWFKGAMESEPGVIFVTEPYPFWASKSPGITISTRWQRPGEKKSGYVSAFDVQLSDISVFTMKLRPTEHGKAFVITDDERMVGLPADQKFDDPLAVQASILDKVSDLGVPLLHDAFREWKKRNRTEDIFPFQSQGEKWWAGFNPHRTDNQQRFWIGVLIPDEDLLPQVAQQRNMILAAVLGCGLLIAAVMLFLSIRNIRKNMQSTVSRLEDSLGQYRLKYKIGDGGNGSVYRAGHALLRRPTAIKLMHPEYASSETAKKRFEHEVQTMSCLAHPNTVAVYDYGKTPDGTLYYAMEYLAGINLDDLVQVKGPLLPSRVIHILRQVCGSLAEAHDKGMIHRDIKPSNIMLCERGGLYDVVKVLDFGLAKAMQQKDVHLTQANTVVGTPMYMAPEIISSPDRISPRSDLYALGAVGYYLLTGANVFEGSNSVEICASHIHNPPPPPSVRTRQPIPADLEKLILLCLKKQPDERPESARALADRLSECEDAGGWTEADAQAWWSTHEITLPLDDEQQSSGGLSNTQILVDMDQRGQSSANSGGTYR